jgi:hypothetical protein
MIDRLTKQFSKYESHDNNKEVKHSKEEEQKLGRENKHDYTNWPVGYIFDIELCVILHYP